MTTSDRRPHLRADLIVRQIEEDFVVYDPITDGTALLNAAAAAMLEFCDGHHTAEEIASDVAQLFALEADAVTRDVQTALADFDSHRWLDTD